MSLEYLRTSSHFQHQLRTIANEAIEAKNANIQYPTWRQVFAERRFAFQYLNTLLTRYAKGEFTRKDGTDNNLPSEAQLAALGGDVNTFLALDTALKELLEDPEKIFAEIQQENNESIAALQQYTVKLKADLKENKARIQSYEEDNELLQSYLEE